MKKINLLIIILTILISSCKKDNNDGSQPQVNTKTFASVGPRDGIIVNSSPRVVQNYYTGGQGKEITMGWDANGYAMRGFLFFDISDLAPAAGYILKIDEANLKVYEANTNMNPFSGEGTHMVDCYLIDYGSLTGAAYDDQYIAKCGTIATSGYSVLTEHALPVTTPLSDLITSYPSTNDVQFRLQFTSDSNVAKSSILTQAMWNIFSGDHSDTNYVPKLEVKYHYEKK